jgi:hypothetical protein
MILARALRPFLLLALRIYDMHSFAMLEHHLISLFRICFFIAVVAVSTQWQSHTATKLLCMEEK